MREAKEKLIGEREPNHTQLQEQSTFTSREEKIKKMETEQKKMVANYKSDYVQFMSKKLTKGGQTSMEKDTDSSVLDLGKMPKRQKNRPQDTVDEIANNVQALINFGREQQIKLNELKRM